MLIGVISDTHDLLRPQVFDVFRGVDRILHAGDIGGEDILIELEALAPVDAVYGNTDSFPLTARLPEWRKLDLDGVSVFLTHVGGSPSEIRRRWRQSARAQAVVFGHSHKPLIDRQGGVLYFNPGAAGPRRFSLPVTVGLLRVKDGQVQAETVELQV